MSADGAVRGPLVLCILDGVGLRDDDDPARGNAVAAAEPAFYDSIFRDYPSTRLACMGPAVGLPEGQMGNSEVGHLTIGAGRVVPQELMRIGDSIASGVFRSLPEWIAICDRLKETGGALHLLGLVSPGGVHSHTDHLYGIVEAARDAGIDDIRIHAFLDGRDTDRCSGLGYVEALEAELARIGAGRIVSVGGRYWGMDRDKRWERVETAWKAIVEGAGPTGTSAAEVIRASYDADVTDEFVPHTVLTGDDGVPLGPVRDGDGVFFWNFRADRARELTWAFNREDFDGFDRPVRPDVAYLCMTGYDESLDVPVLYHPHAPENILADVLEFHELRNLRTAETEKYAHVTYFLNGGREQPYPGEDRRLVPSPKVATYDLQPEMSAPEVAEGVIEAIGSGDYDLIVVNFANGDMVGHTGVLEAATQAFRTLDDLLERIVGALLAHDGEMLLTADHGNCEEMIDATGRVLTNHTLNDVPCVLIGERWRGRTGAMRDGRHGLSDIAPTLLALLELDQPEEMTGASLLA